MTNQECINYLVKKYNLPITKEEEKTIKICLLKNKIRKQLKKFETELKKEMKKMNNFYNWEIELIKEGK